MNPIDMTVMHDPDNGKIGDCFRCCVASILELPANEVPHFMDYPWDGPDPGQWFGTLNRWLGQFDLAYVEHETNETYKWDWAAYKANGFECYHVLSGRSPRALHSTVGLNGVMVHDPHPSRAGLIGPNDEGNYSYGFFLLRGNRRILNRLEAV